MTAIFYLKDATTQAYSGLALSYAAKFNMVQIASNLGITAGSIAGAMAEENMAYGFSDQKSDNYVISNFDPTTFGNTVSSLGGGITGLIAAYGAYSLIIENSSPRTNAEWHALYQPIGWVEARNPAQSMIAGFTNPAYGLAAFQL